MREWSWFPSKAKHSTFTVIPVYAPTTDAKEAEVEWFYDDLQELLELSPKKKRCPFYHKGLERKSRKSRDTKNNKQVWPWSRKWSKAKANRILSRKHAGHSKHPFPTTQEATQHMDITITITRWSIPKLDWLCSLQLRMEKLYTVSKNKTWSQLWLRLWATYCKIQA